jgi:hypothetical protein
MDPEDPATSWTSKPSFEGLCRREEIKAKMNRITLGEGGEPFSVTLDIAARTIFREIG